MRASKTLSTESSHLIVQLTVILTHQHELKHEQPLARAVAFAHLLTRARAIAHVFRHGLRLCCTCQLAIGRNHKIFCFEINFLLNADGIVKAVIQIFVLLISASIRCATVESIGLCLNVKLAFSGLQPMLFYTVKVLLITPL